MSLAYTLQGVHNLGAVKLVHGSFTSAQKDNTITLGKTTGAAHGLGAVFTFGIHFDKAGVDVPPIKVTNSDPTVTGSVVDTLGLSGNWWVMGR